MIHGLIFSLVIVSLPAGRLAPAGEKPLPVILDTDMGNDIDDVFALAMLHALQGRKECEILAVTVSKNQELAGPFCDVMNTFYGHEGIPIGVLKTGKPEGNEPYLGKLLEPGPGEPAFPHRLKRSSDASPAVAVLRKALASQADQSVVMIAIGPLTNMKDLLKSPGDDASPLSGTELVAKKVRQLVSMAGDFRRNQAEFNVFIDAPAASTVIAEWPTEIVFCPFEMGEAIHYPGESLENDFLFEKHHPVREADIATFGKLNGFMAWDLVAVLHAVRPNRGYFDLSPRGTVHLDKENVTRLEENPDGKHRHLIPVADRVERVREAISGLASQPPEKKAP